MLEIKTVTVVGANGTMGTNVSAIFASFGDAKVYMVSRDLEKSKMAAQRAGKTVKADSIVNHLVPADYSMLAECVKESDLVFESAAENLDIKIDLHTRIGQSLKKGAVACTGSSGLSIKRLAECYPEDLCQQFYGVHMFNPPYQLPLCELTASPYSDMEMYKELKEYLDQKLHRCVATNVHYKPLPMMTAYKAKGIDIKDYPNAYKFFENEITLPLNTKLSEDDVEYVIENLIDILKG